MFSLQRGLYQAHCVVLSLLLAVGEVEAIWLSPRNKHVL
jgi:hypothetical protein